MTGNPWTKSYHYAAVTPDGAQAEVWLPKPVVHLLSWRVRLTPYVLHYWIDPKQKPQHQTDILPPRAADYAHTATVLIDSRSVRIYRKAKP